MSKNDVNLTLASAPVEFSQKTPTSPSLSTGRGSSPSPLSLRLAFKMPPEKAVEYLKQKGYKVTDNWYDIWEDAHAKAFTVAKMTKIDMLKDTKAMLEKSLEEGWSYQKFKKQAQDYYIKKGWWGKQEIRDENGETKTVQLGSKHRIRTIYKQNIQSAYNAGRQLQQLEDVDFAPYWQYICVLDASTRPEHRALHGKVFRYDDPIWAHMYPPNGWGCRCIVRALTGKQAESRGLNIENSSGKLSFEDVTISETTGETRRARAGAEAANDKLAARTAKVAKYTFDNAGKIVNFMPDAGWSSNTGAKAWGIDVQAYNKIEGLSKELKGKFISEMAQNPHGQKGFENFIKNTINSGFMAKGIEKTLTWLSPSVLDKLDIENAIPKTPIVVMQDDRIGHIVGDVKTEKQKITEKQLAELYNILNKPDEIYLDYTKKSSEGLVYIKNLPDSDKCIKVCVKLNKYKSGIPVNYISTAGIVDKSSLGDFKLYKKL